MSALPVTSKQRDGPVVVRHDRLELCVKRSFGKLHHLAQEGEHRIAPVVLARQRPVSSRETPHDVVGEHRRDSGDVTRAKRGEQLDNALRVGMSHRRWRRA